MENCTVSQSEQDVVRKMAADRPGPVEDSSASS